MLCIVRSHEGSIQVETAVGRGTKISLLLPVNAAAVASSMPKAPHRVAQHHKGTILFADDESEIRDLARVVLEEEGYSTVGAKDGNEVIEIFTERHLDLQLVILDLMMPIKTGLEAYLEIKDIDSSAPIAFSSGFNETDALQQLPAKTQSAFLKKPYLADDLKQFVENLLGGGQEDYSR